MLFARDTRELIAELSLHHLIGGLFLTGSEIERATMATKETAERMKDMSDDELARVLAIDAGQRPNVVLAQQEFKRRARLIQHDLNLKLLAEQERWMKSTTKITAWTTSAATLIGAAAGVILTFWLK